MRDNIRNSTRFAGAVKRYHTWPTIQNQTNADHSYHVLRIYCEIFGWTNKNVTTYIIFHDSPEIASGDAPFPSKRECPELAAGHKIISDKWYDSVLGGDPKIYLTDYEILQVKICDLLEMCEFGRIEMRMGNKYGKLIYKRTRDVVLDMMSSIVSDTHQDSIQEYIERIKKL